MGVQEGEGVEGPRRRGKARTAWPCAVDAGVASPELWIYNHGSYWQLHPTRDAGLVV